MHAENFFATLDIGARHNDAAVETPRPQQRWIEYIGAVGRRDEDHALIRFEAVHFSQQRIESLLTLFMSAAQARSAMASDSVNFVDEDNARRILLALLKQVADAACANAHKHFHEVRAGYGKERNVGFSCNRPRKQRFASAWRPDEQYPFRDAPA